MVSRKPGVLHMHVVRGRKVQRIDLGRGGRVLVAAEVAGAAELLAEPARLGLVPTGEVQPQACRPGAGDLRTPVLRICRNRRRTQTPSCRLTPSPGPREARSGRGAVYRTPCSLEGTSLGAIPFGRRTPGDPPGGEGLFGGAILGHCVPLTSGDEYARGGEGSGFSM